MGVNATTFVPAYVAGEILTAADLTVTNSGIPVFATTTTRDAAFGGTGEKVLAEGQYAYTEDTNTLWVYDGAAWVGGVNTTSLNGIGSWTTYTPVWSSSGTQPVLGNGSIAGRYAIVNKIGFAQIRIVVGSTTTVGTGNYYVSFPVAAGGAATGFGLITSSFQIYDASAGTAYNGNASYMGNGSTFRSVIYANSTQAANTWGLGSPITPANADEFNFNIVYEVA